jgi:hypothetical protein
VAAEEIPSSGCKLWMLIYRNLNELRSDNRFLSNQLLAAGKDCGAVAWSALPFLCPLKLGIFWWVVLTPQSSVAVSSGVNEALKTLDLSGFLGYAINSLKDILYD